MKQLLQDLSKKLPDLVEAPAPGASAGTLLIDTSVSLISTGTERMLVDFGGANLLQKARQQPDKVRMVLEKMKTDGLMTTIDAVRSKLAEPIPLGYCNVGRVREIGAGVEGFLPGDRVVSNGPHADVVRVPKNLCARIPETVSNEQAVFTVLASIGLQGIRLAAPTLGETIVVTGVGLIGLLTVQLLVAQGNRVLAIDFDPAKLNLAQHFGAEICNPGAGEDPIAAGMAFSRGQGVDAVIITATTKSSDPVSQAAQMSRKRGRIILVGVTGLELNRTEFYEKELTFQVSCSYGPGRYDSAYEQGGQDYPLGFVRWTEKRNFEAILDLLAAKRLNPMPLISDRFSFEKALEAYGFLTSDKTALGILLDYDHSVEERHGRSLALSGAGRAKIEGTPVISMIGAGNYASRILIPAFKKAGAEIKAIASSGGVSGAVHGRKAGFAEATSDTDALITDPAIDTVVIATQHDTHARFVCEALAAGKNVFVEKPLAITREDIDAVEAAHRESKSHLMVGFNRRFAPHVRKLKAMLDSQAEPKSFTMLMNAGHIPPDHWIQDQKTGGGRIIGEACHHIDLMRFLAGAPIVSVQARRMGNTTAVAVTEDKAAILLGFADGSFGTIHYFANGASNFPKERIEVFVAGRTLQLDNFLTMRGFGGRGFRRDRLWRQDKGQVACPKAFMEGLRTGKAAIPPEEIFEVSRVTIDVADMLRAQT